MTVLEVVPDFITPLNNPERQENLCRVVVPLLLLYSFDIRC